MATIYLSFVFMDSTTVYVVVWRIVLINIRQCMYLKTNKWTDLFLPVLLMIFDIKLVNSFGVLNQGFLLTESPDSTH